MKIKITEFGSQKPREFGSFAQFFDQQLDGSGYGTGRLEAAAETASNCSQAIGNLVAILFAKELLSEEDVKAISGTYADTLKVVKE